MKFIAIWLLASLAFSASALANNGVIFSTSEHVQLLAVNGDNISNPKGRAHLPNGENQVLVKYQGVFQEDNAYYFFRSNPIVVKFNANNTKVTLAFPTLENTKEAQQFNRAPMLGLIDTQNNRSLPFQQGLLHNPNNTNIGNYITALERYNQSNQIASLPPLRPQPKLINVTSPNSPKLFTQTLREIQSTRPKLSFVDAESGMELSSESPAKSKDSQIIETMLNYWYERADESIKADFKAKLVSQ